MAPVRPRAHRIRRALVASGLLVLLTGGQPSAAVAPLRARHVALDLPGPPAAILATDLNGDAEPDLVVPVIYSEFEELEFERSQGFVQITEIVPALFERRELRAWLRRPDGSYIPLAAPMEMPVSVLSIEAGPQGSPLIALTDDGVARLRLVETPDGGRLVMEPLFHETTALRGAGFYLPGLGLLKDLDGAGGIDLLVPGARALLVHTATAGPDVFAPAQPVALEAPGTGKGTRAGLSRRYPMPRLEDVDGDGLPDMVLQTDKERGRIEVHRGAGRGRFHPAKTIDLLCPDPVNAPGELAHFGDLDGDGRAEMVFRVEHESGDDGLDEAREPRADYEFHRVDEGLVPQRAPWQTLQVVGYGFGGAYPRFEGSGFQDLDGDGRKDLVTLTLDFSMMQVLRVLTTKRFGLKMHFQPWAQREDGTFHKVPDQELSAKFVIDLDDFRMSRLPLFAGDFDGDRAVDFVEADGGRVIRIRRGHAGSSFSRQADWELRLEEAPGEPGLLKVADLDRDGMADVALTRPLETEPGEATSPVRLDLYLSRGVR